MQKVISTAQLNQEQELEKSLSQITASVDVSNQALFDHITHANQLVDMIEGQDEGPVKKELSKVLA